MSEDNNSGLRQRIGGQVGGQGENVEGQQENPPVNPPANPPPAAQNPIEPNPPTNPPQPQPPQQRQQVFLSAPAASPSESDSNVPTDEDEDEKPLNSKKLAQYTKSLPAASDEIRLLDSALSVLSPRWRNWVVRGIFSFLMISGFAAIVYGGPLALMLLVLAIQIKCFKEIIDIGHCVYRVHGLPWFRSLSWYLVLVSNYFFFGESLLDYFSVALRKDEFLKFLIVHHRFISFALYIFGFVWFVLSLVKRYYMRQFSLFAWTHVTLLLIVTQSYLIIQNIFEGMIWFLVPVSMIICNDIMAYIFGFFFGRTPLIKLSPKKTWEGFIGGAISTILFGMAMSYVLLHSDWFICPIDYDEDMVTAGGLCQRPVSFQLQYYNLPKSLATILRILRLPSKVGIYPMIIHSLVMALFASLIGPFGGFFASGFKRAFKIKDFGAVIPGHGGLMDRFDCQLLMGTFVNVYIHTFIRIPNPAKLIQQILFLRPDEQLAVFHLLHEKLIMRGLLPNETISSN